MEGRTSARIIEREIRERGERERERERETERGNSSVVRRSRL
jgi:hypothetical protein